MESVVVMGMRGLSTSLLMLSPDPVMIRALMTLLRISMMTRRVPLARPG